MRSRTGRPRDTSLRNDGPVLDHMCHRLATLGAGAEITDEVRRLWLDPDTPESARLALNAMPDTALVDEIVAFRRDREEAYAADPEVADRRAKLDAHAGQLIAETPNVRALLDRVGDDRDLAAAVLRVERAGAARVTLTRVLEAIADGAA